MSGGDKTDQQPVGGETDEPPPADAAPVADVPPPDTAALADASAAAATAATSTWGTQPTAAPAPVLSDASAPGGGIAASLPVGSELAQQRPEVLVGAAFAGAFLFARILKHITSE
jgi:hypothetical protein